MSAPLCERCIGVSRISLLSCAHCRQPQPRSEEGKDCWRKAPTAGTTDYVALQDATARAVRRAEDEVRLHFGSSENQLKV